MSLPRLRSACRQHEIGCTRPTTYGCWHHKSYPCKFPTRNKSKFINNVRPSLRGPRGSGETRAIESRHPARPQPRRMNTKKPRTIRAWHDCPARRHGRLSLMLRRACPYQLIQMISGGGAGLERAVGIDRDSFPFAIVMAGLAGRHVEPTVTRLIAYRRPRTLASRPGAEEGWVDSRRMASAWRTFFSPTHYALVKKTVTSPS